MKMKYLSLLAIPAVCLLLAADAKEAKCPISGKPAKSDISLNVNGKTVAFCCNACPDAYKKSINLSAEEAKACPISGKATKAETAVVEKSAEIVHFCCNNCPKKFAEKNKFEIKDEGPKKCPVSGEPAKNEEGTSLTVNAQKVYFCCKSCVKGYLKDLGLKGDAEVTKCPQSGQPGKAETAQVIVKSKTVAFCCGNCQSKYVEKNFKDGVKVPVAAAK